MALLKPQNVNFFIYEHQCTVLFLIPRRVGGKGCLFPTDKKCFVGGRYVIYPGMSCWCEGRRTERPICNGIKYHLSARHSKGVFVHKNAHHCNFLGQASNISVRVVYTWDRSLIAKCETEVHSSRSLRVCFLLAPHPAPSFPRCVIRSFRVFWLLLFLYAERYEYHIKQIWSEVEATLTSFLSTKLTPPKIVFRSPNSQTKNSMKIVLTTSQKRKVWCDFAFDLKGAWLWIRRH